MTIRIIRTASLGLPVGTIRTFAAGVEAALIADKEAVADSGYALTPAGAKVTADAAGNLFSDGKQIQAAVSGAGNAAVLTVTALGGLTTGSLLSALPATGWSVSGYQWTRDGVDIAGATSSTYVLVTADAGKVIGCRGAAATYTASVTAAAAAYPAGQLYLDSLPLYIDTTLLSFA